MWSRTMRFGVAMTLCAIFSFATAASPTEPTESPPVIDAAAWGVYATVGGQTRRALAEDGYALRWVWVRPNEELREDYIGPDGSVGVTQTLTRGAEPGTLELKTQFFGKIWYGTVQPDGSVLFVGRGMIKRPYVNSLRPDGAFVAQLAKLRDGQVESLDAPDPYATWLAPAPAAPAAAAEPAVAVAGAAAPTAAATGPGDFGLLDRLGGKVWLNPVEEWSDDGVLYASYQRYDRAPGSNQMRVDTGFLGHAETGWTEIFAWEPGNRAIVRTGYRNVTLADEFFSEFVPQPDGSIVQNNYRQRRGKKELLGATVLQLLSDGRLQSSIASSVVTFVPIDPADLPRFEAAATERERQAKADSRRQSSEDSEAFWGGLYNALQVVSDDAAAEAAASQQALAETIAAAKAQDVASRAPEPSPPPARPEPVAPAAAPQPAYADEYEDDYSAADAAESARLHQENLANLAQMQAALEQARAAGMDPTMLADLEEAVAGVEESLRDEESPGAGDGGAAAAAAAAADAAQRERAEQARLAEQQRRAADQERAAQERARAQEQARQDQARALANHLAAERNGIRLRALTCPGGGDSYFVAGSRPAVSPKVAQCVSVRFEARCPATRKGEGHHQTAHNFVGGNSCFGDTAEMPKLGCPAE